ncbi:MAG: PDZ domain-containing protein [candidate division Zixibacteria bacterium]|nr:PDZ domain-containing protein [candidate division Zixibacteria bacterium]MDH3936129.1 PDZ domain-containing protein [candidate division Zixibacteria bacterium]
MSLDKGVQFSLNRITRRALKRCFRDGSLSYLSDNELKIILGYIRDRVPKGNKDISDDVANQVLMEIEIELQRGYIKRSGATDVQVLGSFIKNRVPQTVREILDASGKKYQGVLGMILTKKRKNDNNDRPVIIIKTIFQGSEADRAGLKINDRIIGVGSESAITKRQIWDFLKSIAPGSSSKLIITREGETKTLTVDPRNVAFDAHTEETELLDEHIWAQAVIPDTRVRQIFLDVVREALRSIDNPRARVVLMLTILTEMQPSEIYNISDSDKEQLLLSLEEQIELETDERDLIGDLDPSILKSISNVKTMLHRAKREFVKAVVRIVNEALAGNLIDEDKQTYHTLRRYAIKCQKEHHPADLPTQP